MQAAQTTQQYPWRQSSRIRRTRQYSEYQFFASFAIVSVSPYHWRLSTTCRRTDSSAISRQTRSETLDHALTSAHDTLLPMHGRPSVAGSWLDILWRSSNGADCSLPPAAPSSARSETTNRYSMSPERRETRAESTVQNTDLQVSEMPDVSDFGLSFSEVTDLISRRRADIASDVQAISLAQHELQSVSMLAAELSSAPYSPTIHEPQFALDRPPLLDAESSPANETSLPGPSSRKRKRADPPSLSSSAARGDEDANDERSAKKPGAWKAARMQAQRKLDTEVQRGMITGGRSVRPMNAGLTTAYSDPLTRSACLQSISMHQRRPLARLFRLSSQLPICNQPRCPNAAGALRKYGPRRGKLRLLPLQSGFPQALPEWHRILRMDQMFLAQSILHRRPISLQHQVTMSNANLGARRRFGPL